MLFFIFHLHQKKMEKEMQFVFRFHIHKGIEKQVT